ncbi:glutathione peroxidase [Capsulimonas corticalis]|uniref:Glutathione peroxidase n=1 Tax=Capsulimonas corticalis TaxID=2219043 RepID=A0A402CSW5_9BACT|nr:glutathione peroxidase [Capsulimonas corticalis]BDI30940.1 glutathione peroxidase [Capsulimonas corticalis]
MKPTFAITLALAASAMMATIPASAKPKYSGPLQYTVKDISAQDVPLSNYRGDVVLIVNTASLCGNTPQYAGLETLFEKYKSQGLRILAFPANDFAHQEPGSNSDIKEFCTAKYKTTFDLFSKISVKGDDQAPLYKYLTSKDTNPKFGGDIEWNFAKFLIGRDGQVVGRFPAGHDPLSPDVVAAVETELSKKGPKARA